MTLKQLLNLDHMRYTITFMRSKIDILDKAQKSNDENAGPPSSILTTTNPSITHVYLGSDKDETTVAEFVKGSTAGGLVYSVFRKMLEDFLNKFYVVHQLHRERYIEVRGDQKVNSMTLPLGMSY